MDRVGLCPDEATIVAAFALGIEVGDSDREILDYYANSENRAKEVVAFFLRSRPGIPLVSGGS